MLDYQNNRLDYGTLLCPPEGYELERAVTTTYSLDLNTLLAVPVALFYAHTLEGDLSGERLALLDAVRKLKDKVTLYHQAGKIHVPSHYNRLFAYLEDCLVPIVPETPFQSFHPKVWVIRFVSQDKKNPVRYRLIVLSRNLTFDRSWDLAVNLEGVVTEKKQKNNVPLVAFVKSLLPHYKFDDSRRFIQQLGRVDFDVPKGFGRVGFKPMGIAGYQEEITNADCEHLVVMSPFVQDKALKRLIPEAEVPCETWLFSRFAELNKVAENTLLPFNSYCLSKTVVEGEQALEGVDDWSHEDLHAKLFVFTRKDHSRWLIGSANASNPAMGRNVEFMVELSGYGAAIQGPRLVDTLLGEDRQKGVFVEYKRPEDVQVDARAEQLKLQLRKLENRLLHANPKGELVQSENGVNYDLLLHWSLSKEKQGEFEVTVSPLAMDKHAKHLPYTTGESLTFNNLALVDISCFVCVCIKHPELGERKRFLVKIDIEELPENRLSQIFTLLLQNQERFFEYLRFLLAQNPSKEALLPDRRSKNKTENDSYREFAFGAVYEDLLLAASRSPRKLKDVDDVIKRLQAEAGETQIVPEEFLQMWAHFKEYIPNEAN